MIRTAESRDIKDLVNLAEQYFNESPYNKTHKFDKNQATEFLRAAVIKVPYEVAVMEVDNRVVGAALGYLTEYGWCSDIRVCMEFFYIMPQHRDAEAALDILYHIESWGKTMGAVEIQVGDIGFKPAVMEKFYTQQGYTDPGVCLRKML